MKCIWMMGIAVAKRSIAVQSVQEVLTRYGGIIRMRCGYHEHANEEDDGVIILQLHAEVSGVDALKAALCQIEGVTVAATVIK